MPTINAAASFAVPGGPTLALNSAIAAEAYDKIDVAIAPGDDDKVVNIQPGAAAQLRLLVIKSSLYATEVTYMASDGSDDSDPVTLDGPQLFIGPGAIALFGVDPKVLKFSNTHASQAAQVEILVGRDATPG
jgi:hypothetical protein